MRRLVGILALALAVAGCIKNDLPYPVIEASIVSMDVDGALSVDVDPVARTVLIVLEESADIRKVGIRNVTFNDRAVRPSEELVGTRDLSSPLKVSLHTFDDYAWTISAVQPVERYFTVSGQVGGTKIDDVNRRAVTQVSAVTSRKHLDITSLKLGPKDVTTYSPDPSTLHDFTNTQEITVSYRGVTEVWTLFVEERETVVDFESVDAWTKVAWLKASGVAGRENGFRYRMKGEEEWKEVPDVQTDGGTFTACVDSLVPETEYECCAFSGADVTETRAFTTEKEIPVPNGSFETFSHAESDKYFSFYDPASSDPALQTKWWGSGNKGSTTVGASYAITLPDATASVDGEYSVQLNSEYVIIKFAAGNIFTGEYYKTIGTSGGVVRFGRPFTGRPRKLTVWVRYHSGTIPEKCFNDRPEGDPVKAGDKDRGSVWIALGNWDYHKYGGSEESPVEINTNDKSTFFDPEGENVIAYGRHILDDDVEEWTKIEVPLEYRTVSRKPTHIIISCASSLLGDYFTGSPDSAMWIDDLRLEY